MGTLKKVKVLNEADIDDAIEQFMPGSDSPLRKMLMDGMDMLKKKYEAYERITAIDEDTFGGYKSAALLEPSLGWLDSLLREKLDAKREKMTVYWILDGNKYVFDYNTGRVIKK